MSRSSEPVGKQELKEPVQVETQRLGVYLLRREQKILTYFFVLFFAVPADCAESGSSNGEEKAGKTEGDAGPSCSSLSSKASGDSKSRFFDDSEESEEGEEEEEEGSDEEVRREDPKIKHCVELPKFTLNKFAVRSLQSSVLSFRREVMKKRATAPSWKRTRRRERRTRRRKMRRKCACLEWMAKKRFVGLFESRRLLVASV